MKTLIVTSRVEKLDKNKKTFAVLEISTPTTVYTRNAEGIMTAIKQKSQSVGGVTGWEESNLPSLKGKPDFEFTLDDADEVAGDIVARSVVPYFIADQENAKTRGPIKKDGKYGRMVDSARCVVFGNTEDVESFELEVAKAFKRKGHVLQDRNKQQAAAIKETPVDTEILSQATTQAPENVEADKEAAQAESAS